MEIADFLGIAVIGGLLSLVIDYVKDAFGTESTTTKMITIVLSIVVGGLYVMLRSTTLWTTILGVLAAASTTYALLKK